MQFKQARTHAVGAIWVACNLAWGCAVESSSLPPTQLGLRPSALGRGSSLVRCQDDLVRPLSGWEELLMEAWVGLVGDGQDDVSQGLGYLELLLMLVLVITARRTNRRR